MIVPYSLTCAATQMLWLSYAAITSESAHHYGVSVAAIGRLAVIFPLSYLLLAIPAGLLLDHRFRSSLILGASLVGSGAVLRAVGGSFGWALGGQVLVALAVPLILSSVNKLAREFLPEAARARGIALCVAVNFMGIIVALVLGTTLGKHGHLTRLLTVEAVLAILPILAFMRALSRSGSVGVVPTGVSRGALGSLWGMRQMRLICGLVLVGFGLFVALSTWLQQLLKPAGVSQARAGVLLTSMVIAGIIGCLTIPSAVARRSAHRRYIQIGGIGISLSCLLLAVEPPFVVRQLALIVVGALLLPGLPIVLAFAERLAGPAAVGSAAAIVWMAGNLGGVVVALIIGALVHHPVPAFLAMAVIYLIVLPLGSQLPPNWNAIAVGSEPARETSP